MTHGNKNSVYNSPVCRMDRGFTLAQVTGSQEHQGIPADRADPAQTKLGQPGRHSQLPGISSPDREDQGTLAWDHSTGLHTADCDRLTGSLLPAFAAPKFLSLVLCHQHQMLQFPPRPRIYYIYLAFTVGCLIYHSIFIC